MCPIRHKTNTQPHVKAFHGAGGFAACVKVGNFLPWPLHVGSSNWHISEENYCTDETAPVVSVFVRFQEMR